MGKLVLHMNDARPIWSIPPWAVEEIRRAAAPHFRMALVNALADSRGDGGAAPVEAIAAITGAEVYFGFGFPRELFLAAAVGEGALRWVHSGSAGVGGALYPEMRESPIILTNSAGIHAEPMAETIIGAMLYFARGLDYAVAAKQDRRWEKEAFESPDSKVREIAGATLGIVGFGGIGRAVARRAVALGMGVVAHRRRPGGGGDGVEVLTGEAGLQRILAESDYLLLSLPHTSDTDRLINRERLMALRQDAVVVNVGRGQVLDEEALAEALGNGRLRGAALDVFQREPLSEGSALWDLSNVLITPHVSAVSRGFWRREVDLIVENLRRYLSGEELLNKVDKQAGY